MRSAVAGGRSVRRHKLVGLAGFEVDPAGQRFKAVRITCVGHAPAIERQVKVSVGFNPQVVVAGLFRCERCFPTHGKRLHPCYRSRWWLLGDIDCLVDTGSERAGGGLHI